MIVRCEAEYIFPFERRVEVTDYMSSEEILQLLRSWKNDGQRLESFIEWLEGVAAAQYSHELSEDYGHEFSVIYAHLYPQERRWLEETWEEWDELT